MIDSPWSPADPPRDGAAEFRVLSQLAQLQHRDPAVSIVDIGNRRGLFQQDSQRALEFAARRVSPELSQHSDRWPPALLPSKARSPRRENRG